MKKEIPAGVIGAAIVGLLAVVGFALYFLMVKSDPAAQAPNPPPRFDAAQKAAESSGQNPMMNRGPQPVAGSAQKPGATVP